MSEPDRKVQAESIANIIQKFETFQSSPHLSVVDNDRPPRPITAPPNLPGNHRTLVQRKDELISRLCEEVCYLNSQVLELQDSKQQLTHTETTTESMKESTGHVTDHVTGHVTKGNRRAELFDDNYFIISGAVSPLEEMSANITTVSNKHLNPKEISLDHEKSEFIQKILQADNTEDTLSYKSNKLSLSPKQSNVGNACGEKQSNVAASDNTTVLNVTDNDQDEETGSSRRRYRQHFTSSQSDIENFQYEEFDNCTSSRDATMLMSSSDSLLNSEELIFSSEGSTPQNSRGLQRCGGFENLFDVEGDNIQVSASPDLRECVAKCDWTVEQSPAGSHGNRTQQSLTFDEMNEWNLSNSDLTNHNCLSPSPSIPDNNMLSNGYHHNADSNLHHDSSSPQDGGGGPENGASLRGYVEMTQEHCDRMMDEFHRMRRYLRNISEEVYSGGHRMLDATSHLACSQELLDNDSVQSSRRHSRAESPWCSVNNVQEEEEEEEERRVARLKRTKSGVRLINKKQTTVDKDSESSLTIRQLVREVCNEEALNEAASLRAQLLDKDEENEQLHCENDHLVHQMSGLDTRIADLTEQLSKLQSLNRSLQAQNFNLSTTLSHKDATFDKLKKYLHKGPPSRSQSTSPLTSIAEVANNTAHKYGFLNRSSTSISRRKSIRPWKRRLTLLDTANISTFKVESVESLIPIKSIVDVHTDSKKAYGKHVIVITTDDSKEHYLQASSHEDLLEWVLRIENLLPCG